jgi:uncharacterized membrane-anchored protein YhcB (DUF1043 family)
MGLINKMDNAIWAIVGMTIGFIAARIQSMIEEQRMQNEIEYLDEQLEAESKRLNRLIIEHEELFKDISRSRNDGK